MNAAKPVAEYDYTERCFTGRYYILVKVLSPAGDHLSANRATGELGPRYFVRKRIVPAPAAA